MQYNLNYLRILILGVFLTHSLLQATIPVSHIKGVDELFKYEFRPYSPLIGLLHYHTTIPTLFEEFENNQQNDEYLKKLYELLFIRTPSTEIAPSHLPSNPAANLSGPIIAKLLIELETLKKNDVSKGKTALLTNRILNIIISDKEYQINIEQAKDNIKETLIEKQNFDLLLKEQEQQNKAAEKFRKESLAPTCVEFKKEKAKLKKQNQESSPEFLALSQKKQALELQYESMKSNFINTDQKADMVKKINNQLKGNDITSELYLANLHNLAKILAKSFIRYDLKEHKYPHATTIALLSYLWMKYDNKLGLRGYLEIMGEAKFLLEWIQLNDNFYLDYYSEGDYTSIKKNFLSSKKKSNWVSNNLVDSIVLATDYSTGDDIKALEHIHFSYTSWMSYNPKYADCAENAVHNIINLIAFNPSTGLYDVEILKRLKEKYYPNLSLRLIKYYSDYSTFKQHSENKVKKEWLDMLDGLNKRGISKEQKIRYLRTSSEVLANYANIVRVVNNLLGYSDVTQDNMVEIFSRVKEVSGFTVDYANGSSSHKGSEQIKFKVGKTTFILTTYGHLHCIFNRQKNHDNELTEEILHILNKKAKDIEKSSIDIFYYNSAYNYLYDCQKPTAL